MGFKDVLKGLAGGAAGLIDFKAPERKERAFRDESAARARNIIQETTEGITKSGTEGAQEARKAFTRRQENKANRLRSELSRRGLLGSPVESAAIEAQERETARASDRLGVELARQQLEAQKAGQAFRGQSLLSLGRQQAQQGRVKSFGEQVGEAGFDLLGTAARRGIDAAIPVPFK